MNNTGYMMEMVLAYEDKETLKTRRFVAHTPEMIAYGSVR
jgi:hypothetical protein